MSRPEQRLDELHQISKLLTSSGTAEEAVGAILGIIGPALGLRSAALLEKPDGPEWRLVVWPSQGDLTGPCARAAIDHLSTWFAEQVGASSPGALMLDEHLGVTPLPAPETPRRAAGDGPYLVVPLALAGRSMFGAIQIEALSRFDAGDLDFISTIANQLSVAIDLERSISAERDAVLDKRFLLEATRALSAILDPAGAPKVVAGLAVPRLGDFCVFDVRGPDGRLSRSGWAHVQPAGQRAFDEAFAARAQVDSATELPGRELVTAAQALLRVPVTLAGRSLGELTFGFVSPTGRYGVAEHTLAEGLAQRAAFALESSHLHHEIRRAVQSREQVVEVLSHDLRNPLSVVMMATSSLGSHGPGPVDKVDLGKNVARIHRAGERMLALINKLVDFGTIEGGRLALQPRPCDAAQLLHDAVTASEPFATTNRVVLVVNLPAEPLPEVTCDKGRIVQALASLVENAVKMPSRTGVVTLAAEVRDHELVLSVTDTGPGLSADDVTRIFQRYERGTGVGYRGNGLGLGIAIGIVEHHRGRIWAESELGSGATFLLALPLQDGDAAEPPVVHHSSHG